MIKKTAIMLVCGVTSILGSDEKLEFMKNGATWRANMTLQEKFEFMRNKGQTSQQIIDLTQQAQQATNVKETKPIAKEPPLQVEQEIIQDFPLNEDDLLTENQLINHAIKLSLDDNQTSTNREPSNDNQPKFNETIQKIINVPGKNIIINYNVTMNQKLHDSSQNINIGKKNSNS